eukprot:gnl/TRDRNA2_/TRDRNA2_181137_c0_seq1.p1 gnl/TRDRNA2_/TRDRNA2_181137_c0~~gnl/TRDRNA2_/TRDRNA2_181137_c0_seq1.p1  ORF type:complete len:625 (+),score=88.08 gnl/TRDRNA2_/TRDRNA2_181137_c0_seq1:79-1953(+)
MSPRNGDSSSWTPLTRLYPMKVRCMFSLLLLVGVHQNHGSDEGQSCDIGEAAPGDEVVLLRMQGNTTWRDAKEESDSSVHGRSGSKRTHIGPGWVANEEEYRKCWDLFEIAYSPTLCCPSVHGTGYCASKGPDTNETLCSLGRQTCWGHGFSLARCCPDYGLSKILRARFLYESSSDAGVGMHTTFSGKNTVLSHGNTQNMWKSKIVGKDQSFLAKEYNTNAYLKGNEKQWLIYGFDGKWAKVHRVDIALQVVNAVWSHMPKRFHVQVPDCQGDNSGIFDPFAPWTVEHGQKTGKSGELWLPEKGFWRTYTSKDCVRPSSWLTARCSVQIPHDPLNPNFWRPQIAYRLFFEETQDKECDQMALSSVEFFGAEAASNEAEEMSSWDRRHNYIFHYANVSETGEIDQDQTWRQRMGYIQNETATDNPSEAEVTTGVRCMLASSNFNEEEGENKTIDGSPLSYWQSAPRPKGEPGDEWLVYDLNSEADFVNVSRIQIYSKIEAPDSANQAGLAMSRAPRQIALQIPNADVCGGWYTKEKWDCEAMWLATKSDPDPYCMLKMTDDRVIVSRYVRLFFKNAMGTTLDHQHHAHPSTIHVHEVKFWSRNMNTVEDTVYNTLNKRQKAQFR